MTIDNVRVSKQGRDQLSRLKARTGIGQWNILCRWALCISLAEEGNPRAVAGGERPIEMTWRTFGGEYADVYLAMITERCAHDGLELSPSVLSEQLHAHIHRGIGYLAGDPSIKSIDHLIQKALAVSHGDRAPT
ncbi:MULTISPECIES: DNA sulfur modification protein DndE [unclassified Thioalkalivibrio]|uniref:DNA sulfur modification protein DndE n=1 Tax=unclassified Thioalkalivibrio TaxID=2621013 RepID=UPI0009DB3C25|nr:MULTISPECIES: DNA sulfur modification protein DndE [unclassified Thioalkalivibrio]